MNTITLTQPDDWHLHVRDGDVLKDVMADTARCFGRAIIMPNLKPPVTTTQQALDYQQRINAALPSNSHFQALMTLYLTDNTRPEEIVRAKTSGQIHAVKYYPAGATTNSDAGVTDMRKTYTTLQAMAEQGLPLLVHGEVTDPAVDVFDREKVFIERVLIPMMEAIPQLRIVFEHITTEDAVNFVHNGPANLAATITPHHLLWNRNEMFRGGLRPHAYCLPVLKRETHRQALLHAATSGHAKFFLGTDSAPHAISAKETACGCAGIYNAPVAMEIYASVFELMGKLDKLEAFASLNGPAFYGLPINSKKITLQKQDWQVNQHQGFGTQTIQPMCAGETLSWKLLSA
jgi:dihydroorotase